MNLLEVKGLTVADTRNGEQIIKELSFSLQANSCLAIVGESGSGKSMTCQALLGLLRPGLEVSGSACFHGKELLHLPAETLRVIRGRKICLILQDAMTAFDPLDCMGVQLVETLVTHKEITKKEARALALSGLERMCIRNPAHVLQQYPHQLSGGMLQRCMIVLALLLEPEIIIADEPTTALDTVTQKEVVEAFLRLRELLQTSMIFVSHDLGLVQRLATQVLVMKAGRAVESGTSDAVFFHPRAAYTKYLIETRMALTKKFRAIMGQKIP